MSLSKILEELEADIDQVANTTIGNRVAESRNIRTLVWIAKDQVENNVLPNNVKEIIAEVRERVAFLLENPNHSGKHEGANLNWQVIVAGISQTIDDVAEAKKGKL